MCKTSQLHAHKERIIPRAVAVVVLTYTVELQIGFAKVELNRDKFNLRTNEEAFCFPFCLPLSPPFPHWPIPGYQFAAEFIVGSSVHRIFKLMAPNRAYKFPLRNVAINLFYSFSLLHSFVARRNEICLVIQRIGKGYSSTCVPT